MVLKVRSFNCSKGDLDRLRDKTVEIIYRNIDETQKVNLFIGNLANIIPKTLKARVSNILMAASIVGTRSNLSKLLGTEDAEFLRQRNCGEESFDAIKPIFNYLREDPSISEMAGQATITKCSLDTARGLLRWRDMVEDKTESSKVYQG